MIGGDKMMRSLFLLWWRAWTLYAHSVRVYEASLSNPNPQAQTERTICNKMYQELRHIHSYGIADKDITDEMLLFSVINGFTKNLRFIVMMNKGNRSVRAKRFTEVFPRCGTSLLNKSTKHADTHKWLINRFTFKSNDLIIAKRYKKWYKMQDLYQHYLPSDRNLLPSDGQEFQDKCVRIIDGIKEHFDQDTISNHRQEVVATVKAFVADLCDSLSKSNILCDNSGYVTYVPDSAGILSCKPKLVGSANEGTRPFLPDEYDYMLVLTELKKCVRMKQHKQHLTMCDIYLNTVGKKKLFLKKISFWQKVRFSQF